MRKIIIGLFICMLFSSVCQAFEPGRYVSDRSENGFEGSLEIRQKGPQDFELGRIEFGKRDEEYLDLSCVAENGGVMTDGGQKLEVYNHGGLGLTIVQQGDYLQVIPNMTVNDLMCREVVIPEWVRTFKGRDDMSAEISSLKWRKADAIPSQP